MNSDKKALWLVIAVVILIITASSVGDKHASHCGTQYQKLTTGR